ncbi:MAG: threonine/serine dehydratase [Candidatus Binatia bacterium]|nr:threonine/serine dehydratase [Candidatus Binatia bacterium]
MVDVTFPDILAAAERIAPWVHRTPLHTCTSLSREFGAHLWFKCEQFQRTGSFKFRGACNAVFSLPSEAGKRGVVTHSSGNHGQALARAAALRGIPAYVVMPEGAVRSKEAAARAFGAQVIPCGRTLAARERVAAEVQLQTGAEFVHPYDDPRVIAGQGTLGLELLKQLGDVDFVVAPVGGGGLLSGVCLAVHAQAPHVRIYAAEPAGADDAARSLASGRRQGNPEARTIADGLHAELSERTFAILREHLSGVVVVEDSAIARSMRLLWERTKWIVEASAAIAFAALSAPPLVELIRNRRVVVILSGGNVDLDRLPWTQSQIPVYSAEAPPGNSPRQRKENS